MILRILNKKFLSESESKAESNISTKLGGLILAIDIVAEQIKMSCRFRSIAEFLLYFEQKCIFALKRPERRALNPW